MATGTVSLTNIEHGSNSNGKYVKFPDGTLICWVEHKATLTINTAWGGVYESPAQQSLGAWPHAFNTIPNVLAYPLRYSGTVSAFLEQITDTSTTSVGNSYYWCPKTQTNIPVGATIVGIGTWK